MQVHGSPDQTPMSEVGATRMSTLQYFKESLKDATMSKPKAVINAIKYAFSNSAGKAQKLDDLLGKPPVTISAKGADKIELDSTPTVEHSKVEAPKLKPERPPPEPLTPEEAIAGMFIKQVSNAITRTDTSISGMKWTNENENTHEFKELAGDVVNLLKDALGPEYESTMNRLMDTPTEKQGWDIRELLGKSSTGSSRLKDRDAYREQPPEGQRNLYSAVLSMLKEKMSG